MTLEAEVEQALKQIPKPMIKMIRDGERPLEIENGKPPMISLSLFEYANLHQRIRQLEAANSNLKTKLKRKKK
jgi:hypothetical protein